MKSNNNYNDDDTTYVYFGGKISDSVDRYKITHVKVSEGVEAIAEMAFHRCRELKSIQFPTTLKKIGREAFSDCISLSSIDLPEPLEEIDEYAFVRCIKLLKVKLPRYMTSLGGHAFSQCSNLSSVEILSSISVINEGTFDFCSLLSKVVIPSSVTIIKADAFQHCHMLTSITLHPTTTHISRHAFHNCGSLRSVQIPPSTLVDDAAFDLCHTLKIIYSPTKTYKSISYSDINDLMEVHKAILLTSDEEGPDVEYDGEASLTLENIEECISSLPENIPQSQQLHVLHEQFHESHPQIAKRAHVSKFNLLHLLVYFPGDIYDALFNLIRKCPQATLAADITGRTPLHHAVTCTKHCMDSKSYNYLLQQTPAVVVPNALQSVAPWHEVQDVVKEKIVGLSVEDEETGLLPFMMAAVACKVYRIGFGLSVVFELLCMQPDVLLEYNVSTVSKSSDHANVGKKEESNSDDGLSALYEMLSLHPDDLDEKYSFGSPRKVADDGAEEHFHVGDDIFGSSKKHIFGLPNKSKKVKKYRSRKIYK